MKIPTNHKDPRSVAVSTAAPSLLFWERQIKQTCWASDCLCSALDWMCERNISPLLQTWIKYVHSSWLQDIHTREHTLIFTRPGWSCSSARWHHGRDSHEGGKREKESWFMCVFKSQKIKWNDLEIIYPNQIASQFQQQLTQSWSTGSVWDKTARVSVSWTFHCQYSNFGMLAFT